MKRLQRTRDQELVTLRKVMHSSRGNRNTVTITTNQQLTKGCPRSHNVNGKQQWKQHTEGERENELGSGRVLTQDSLGLAERAYGRLSIKAAMGTPE
jgi:hypothetical protein